MSGNSLEHAPVIPEAAEVQQPMNQGTHSFEGLPDADAWKLYAEMSTANARVDHNTIELLTKRCLASVQLVSV